MSKRNKRGTVSSVHRFITMLLGIILIVSVMPVQAEEKPAVTLDAEVLVVSKYIWRGLEVNEDFILQPSITTRVGGFSFNAWGNMDLTNFGEDECVYTADCKDRSGQFTEVDLTIDYTYSWDKFSLSSGIINYLFPNWDESEDTYEFYLSSSVDVLLQPTLTIYRDFDEVGGFYANLSIAHSFALGEKLSLDLSTSIGYADSDYNKFYFGVDDSSLVDFNIGASVPISVWENVTVTPVLNYTSLVDNDLRDAVEAGSCCDNEDNIYGGISIAVSF